MQLTIERVTTGGMTIEDMRLSFEDERRAADKAYAIHQETIYRAHLQWAHIYAESARLAEQSGAPGDRWIVTTIDGHDMRGGGGGAA